MTVNMTGRQLVEKLLFSYYLKLVGN